ncbi:hypothetical protein ASPBRDRAFT_54389 [Aspergillus brasiliensis CBS 101740]|uniref:NACHT domain-containing protein n=1 Tax=Aspergillus brasiliensis (strain CBS 101740 / IMI 381727 / IBT 21946) TaxID=767769 RepID=A0A1L9ULH7_ASPBC|nr:hypothetical protein ASPBRDRAFT_54389 [Aspergillus brasiliensis CBS 101740]
MLTKLRAKFCCSQVDGDADKAEPAIPRGKRSIQEGNTTPTKRINPEAASIPPGHAVASPKDLWQVAFDSLDPRQKHWLSKEEQSPIKVIQEVISETENKYTEYKRKELSIRRRDGGEIKVREIAQNILASALSAQQTINAIVSFDPSGHASSAWAIVSLGLTMVQRHIARRDAILEACEYLAKQLAYLACLDTHRRYTNAAEDKQLDNALVEVYSTILEYTAEVRKTHSESGFARIGSTLIPLTEQPLQKLQTAVEARILMAERWATVTDHTYLKVQAANILAAIDKHVEELQKVHSTVLTGVEDKGVLDWLSQFDFSKVQTDTHYNQSPGTGEWLFESEEYIEWKGCPGGILCFQGPAHMGDTLTARQAGCGKSVLYSKIIENIEKTCLNSSNKRFAYWYFQFNNQGSQRVETMLRAVIRQLHSNPLDGPIRRIHEDYGTKGSNPSNAKLQETLHRVITAYEGEIFLILDALDECPETVSRKERSFLLPLLTDLQKKCSDKIHILVTSRPEPDIIEHLRECTALDLEERQGSDISAFVNHKLEALDDRIAPIEVKTRLSHELLQDGKRRFRWADLQLKRLEECRNKSEVLEALETMPQTLHDTYISVIKRIETKPSDVKLAKAILTWLCFCARPLTLTEVAAAAGLGVPEDIIKICTTSFVTYRRSDNGIQLAHSSVKEFLVSSESTGQWHQLSVLSGHTILAEHSLRILLRMTGKLTREAVEQEPLLNYAAPALEELQDMVSLLFRHPTIYHNWRRMSTKREREAQSTPIGAASGLGLIRTVNELLEDGADPLEWFAHEKGNCITLQNAVLIASKNGHLDVLDLLLHNVCISLGLAVAVVAMIQCCGLANKKLKDIFDTMSASGIIYTGTEDQSFHIDEGIVVAAATNRICGMELMAVLLDQYEETGVALVPVTENVLEAVLQNRECGGDILQLLLTRRNADVKIYPQIKNLLASPAFLSDSAIALLLAERHTEIHVNEEFITEFAQYASETAMEILLSTLKDDSLLTENVLVGAAQNKSGVGALRQILRRRKHRAQTSEYVLCVAMCNGNEAHSVEMLEALLDDCGSDFAISEMVMLRVLDDWIYTAKMLNMLLHRQQAGFSVTHEIIRKAASHLSARDVFELLMDNGGLRIPITEDIMLSVWSDDLMFLLLDLAERSQIEALPITEKVMSHAVKVFGTATLEAIFRRRPMANASDDMFVESCHRDISTLSFLLKQPHSQLPVVRMMQVLEAKYDANSADILQYLLDERSFEVDHEIVERFAQNASALRLLLQTTPHVSITEQAVIRAASDCHALSILLDERIEDIPISEEVMIAVVGAENRVAHSQRILAHFGPQVPITEKVLVAASNTLRALQLILETLGHGMPPILTEKVVVLATFRDFSALPWFFEKYGSQALPLTERVMVAAAASRLSGPQWLLREWPAKIDLNHLWRAIWRFDPDFCDFTHGYDHRTLSYVQESAGRHVLQYTRAVDLSEEVFQIARATTRQYSKGRDYSGLLPLIHVCVGQCLPVPATERLVRAVLDNCDGDLIKAIRRRIEALSGFLHHRAGKFEKMLLLRSREISEVSDGET